MTKLYVFGDETGNTDYTVTSPTRGGGASVYFGVGTATYSENDMPKVLSNGVALRSQLSRPRANLVVNGFHACNDSNKTRDEVFNFITCNPPRFDATFLAKQNAYPSVREKGGLYLYKEAWYLHLKYVLPAVSNKNDEIVLVLAEYGTKNLQKIIATMLGDICSQINREVTPCIWRAPTCIGLQIADYGMWATQRDLAKGNCYWFDKSVKPTLESCFFPWDRK